MLPFNTQQRFTGRRLKLRRTVRPLFTFRALFFFLLLGFALGACLPLPPEETPPGAAIPAALQTTPPPVALPTPSATFQPAATPSATPAPTVTPLPAMLPRSSTIHYALPPILRHVDTHSLLLFFVLNESAAGRVYLQTEGQPALMQAFDASQPRHLIRFDDLAAGRRYQAVVAVEAADGSLRAPAFQGDDWAPMTFSTLPEAPPWRVGVIGDASFGDEVSRALIEQMAAADLDFAIHLGDLVYEAGDGSEPFEAYAEKFYQPFAPLLRQMALYPVPGNHDYDSALRVAGEPFYFLAFPPYDADGAANGQFSSLALGDLQFILMDSQTLFGAPGRQEQEIWLRQRLADPAFRASIPIFHVAPFSSSVVHPEDSRPPRLLWMPLFEESAVPLVLSGHFHHYERLQCGNVLCIVAGGGSSVLYAAGPHLPESQLYLREAHFVLLEITSQQIHLSAIGLEGAVLDEVTIALP